MIGEPDDPRRRAAAAWIVVALALALQLWGLYTTSPPDAGGLWFPGMDKIVHVVLFAAPTWALLRVVPKPWMALVPMLVHIPVSEMIQFFWIEGRSGDLLDGLADLLGVAVGWWTAVRVDGTGDAAGPGPGRPRKRDG
ncbi:MAG: VanZ family protein [Propioniciclava sp.]|uniref:VanZ family protein n=1 Tax=Propioniciclava sp. TaxID=2038686 RepID=UPI0039E44D4C